MLKINDLVIYTRKTSQYYYLHGFVQFIQNEDVEEKRRIYVKLENNEIVDGPDFWFRLLKSYQEGQLCPECGLCFMKQFICNRCKTQYCSTCLGIIFTGQNISEDDGYKMCFNNGKHKQ